MSAPAAPQISDWLEKLGMSEYAQRFTENRIDLSVLPDLTDQDLKDLGVVLGDRRKILRAIGELDSAPTAAKAQQPATAAVAVNSAASPPLANTARDGAERRQVTVMFSDLVGSTALSARMDPEDLRGHLGLSEVCRGDCPTVRRVCGEIHGRWCARVFRLSAST